MPDYFSRGKIVRGNFKTSWANNFFPKATISEAIISDATLSAATILDALIQRLLFE